MSEMDSWLGWASLGLGICGLVVSSFGLFYAVLAFRSAEMAKNAAVLAENAANLARVETQRTIGRHQGIIDVESAVERISSLKELHLQDNWQAAHGNYQILRRTLVEIRGNLPEELTLFRDRIDDAVNQVNVMENRVARLLYGQRQSISAPGINAILNKIQQDLETLQDDMKYLGISGGD